MRDKGLAIALKRSRIQRNAELVTPPYQRKVVRRASLESKLIVELEVRLGYSFHRHTPVKNGITQLFAVGSDSNRA